MKTKQVNRYYCDYCKKSGCSKFHILKHEKYCTLNPNRECRMCESMDSSPVNIEKLTEVFSFIEEQDKVYNMPSYADYVKYEKQLIKAIAELRSMTNGCPACILAAIRQAEIPVPAVRNFNYAEEVESFWAENNKKNPI